MVTTVSAAASSIAPLNERSAAKLPSERFPLSDAAQALRFR
jgi:hypothetical protein